MGTYPAPTRNLILGVSVSCCSPFCSWGSSTGDGAPGSSLPWVVSLPGCGGILLTHLGLGYEAEPHCCLLLLLLPHCHRTCSAPSRACAISCGCAEQQQDKLRLWLVTSLPPSLAVTLQVSPLSAPSANGGIGREQTPRCPPAHHRVQHHLPVLTPSSAPPMGALLGPVLPSLTSWR